MSIVHLAVVLHRLSMAFNEDNDHFYTLHASGKYKGKEAPGKGPHRPAVPHYSSPGAPSPLRLWRCQWEA